MLDKGSNVVRKGPKGCIATLLGQEILGDTAVLELTLKPWMKTSSRTLRILSHVLGEQVELEYHGR
jgi:hypothetical protein